MKRGWQVEYNSPCLVDERTLAMRRSRRHRENIQKSVQPAAFFQRTAPVYDILSEEKIARIEDAAENILSTIGISVRHQPSLRLLADAGLDIKGDLVRFPHGFCRQLVEKNAPSQFIQHARNPRRSVHIGGDNMVLVPVYGPPFVSARDIERRYGTLDDFNNFVKLAQLLPEMHHSGGTICEPTDIPVTKRHLDMIYGHVLYSDKPFMGAVTAGERAQDTMKMCQIVFGKKFVAENCVTTNLINLNSPLVLDETMLDAAHIYAKAGQATVITPFIISGASGPTTVAGSVAQSLAETLAAMAIIQLVKPGAPMVFGFMMMGMNMRTGGPLRFDETWKSMLIAGQLSRRLGIPYRCGGSSSSSKVLDAQAGWEGALYMMFSMLAGVNFLIHATGTLEAGLLADFDKFVLDCDMLGAAARMMSEVDVSDEELAIEAVREAGPGGNFLATAHTLARYKSAFYDSTLSDGDSFEQWQINGSQDAATRAHKRMRKLLDEYEKPELDPAINDELIEFMERRKAVLPDSFA